MEIVSSFSERLKTAMKNRGLGVTDLAVKLQISKQSVSAYINGKRKPKRLLLLEISKVLNVDSAWLMGYDTDMQPSNDFAAPSSASFFTKREIALVEAYRNRPDMQPAVDQLLGLASAGKHSRSMQTAWVAAYGKGPVQKSISLEKQEEAARILEKIEHNAEE